MTQETTPRDLVSSLKALNFPRVFNPYVDRCAMCDKPEAPRMRADLLLRVLRAACDGGVDEIWVGRDLGYRGGRRTGLALTDDYSVADYAARWGVVPERSTAGPMVRERTAAAVGRLLEQIEAPIFLWNLFPLHPFPPRDAFGNRAHNARERAAGMALLLNLKGMLRPRRFIALGKVAAHALNNARLDVEVKEVRHPGHGGETLFRRQIAELHGLDAPQ